MREHNKYAINPKDFQIIRNNASHIYSSGILIAVNLIRSELYPEFIKGLGAERLVDKSYCMELPYQGSEESIGCAFFGNGSLTM